MSRPVKYISIFFLAVNALAASSLLYKWSGEIIHGWHMSYYEEKGYPITAVRREYIPIDKFGKAVKPVFMTYS